MKNIRLCRIRLIGAFLRRRTSSTGTQSASPAGISYRGLRHNFLYDMIKSIRLLWILRLLRLYLQLHLIPGRCQTATGTEYINQSDPPESKNNSQVNARLNNFCIVSDGVHRNIRGIFLQVF